MNDSGFREWLSASGAEGIDSLELHESPDTGRGVRSLKEFKKNASILSISSNVLWTQDAALADPIFGAAVKELNPALSVVDTLALYLLYVKSRPNEFQSHRALHVQFLPKSYDCSIFFDSDELAMCSGSSLFAITIRLREQIAEDYSDLRTRLFDNFPDVFPQEHFSLQQYMWALATVWSRGMDFQFPATKTKPASSLRCIVPFADMLNHSSEVETCHVYDEASGCVRVLAGKDYAAGEQVFINYGRVPNNRLLRLYGFVIPNNPNDTYELGLTTDPRAPLYEAKCRLFKAAGLDSSTTINLTVSDPLPLDVARYLRIQRLQPEELGTISMDKGSTLASKPVSGSNEAESIGALADAFKGILNGFSEPLELLERRIADRSYRGNKRAAAIVSIGEQKILRAALVKAEEMVAAVVCAGCEKADLGNK
ncbi:hypothetical protein HK104_000122, partial [Borealophlyctis nickersoniae]